MRVSGNKEISEAGGGVGMRAGAVGGDRTEVRGRHERGGRCETRGAREARERSGRGRARDTKSVRSVRLDFEHSGGLEAS
jgi:hypothetical protein